MKVKLNTLDDIMQFSALVDGLRSDIYIKAGGYTVNADSVLGIMSLPLDKPLEMEIISKDDREIDSFLYELKQLNFLL